MGMEAGAGWIPQRCVLARVVKAGCLIVEVEAVGMNKQGETPSILLCCSGFPLGTELQGTMGLALSHGSYAEPVFFKKIVVFVTFHTKCE